MITFVKQLVRFPIFKIIRLLLLYSVYCNVFVLIDVSGACLQAILHAPVLQ